MRGTFSFKPLKANLTHDTELILKMDPYCSFTVGTQKFKSQICKSGGKNPVWNDEIIIPIDTDQQFAYLQLLDQDRLTKDDNIGTATIDLFEVMNNSNRFVSKWYPIFYKNKSAGEILIEIAFQPSGQTFTNQPFVSGTQNIRQETLPSSGLTGKSTGYPLGTGLEQGTTGYGQGTSGYGQGTSGYGQGTSGYGQGTSGYGQGTSGYSQGTSGLTQNIGSQTSGYGQNVPLQGTTGYKESSLGGTGSTGYGQNIGSQTSGYSQSVGSQNLPLGGQGTSGYSQGVAEVGGQNLPIGSQGTSGYSQGIGGQGLGVQGTSGISRNVQSGLSGQATTLEDPLYGKTVDVQSAGERSYERSYQQGTLGQGNLGQGNLGQGNLGQGNLGQGNLGQGNLNKNLNPEQFNQPGYY